MKATEVTAGLAESNGSLLPGLWRDSLHVTCELTACTPGSAPGPTLGNEYGKTLPFSFLVVLLGAGLVVEKLRRRVRAMQTGRRLRVVHPAARLPPRTATSTTTTATTPPRRRRGWWRRRTARTDSGTLRRGSRWSQQRQPIGRQGDIIINCTARAPLLTTHGIAAAEVAGLLGCIALYKAFLVYLLYCVDAFSALTLLVGRQEEHPACKKCVIGWWCGVVICLERGADCLKI